MKEYKNIDRIFQENFKELEIFPPDRVWKNIEAHLNKKQTSPIIPLYQKLSGVAVAFLLFFSLGLGYLNPWKKDGVSSNVVQKSRPESVSQKQVVEEGTNISNPILLQNELGFKEETNKEITVKQTKLIIQDQSNELAGIEKNNLAIADEEKFKVVNEVSSERATTFSNSYPAKNSNRDFIENLNTDVVQNEKEKGSKREKKWSVGPTIAPVYLNSLQSGSAISETLKDNKTITEEALSYGMKLNYQLTEKINIQSGVNKVELGYNTKDVNLAITTLKYPNHNLKAVTPGIYLSSARENAVNADLSEVQNKSSVDGQLNQSFEYVEVPVEMKYNVFQSKIGLNVVGGISTFILTNNEVSFINPDNFSTVLGESNNINSLNFSGNLGFDIDYKVTKDWFLNVSPMVKYQFNTFSNTSGSFQPFYFGVYSGVNYRF
ncbi:MAG: hypothetical protein U5K51_01230 [Flavobacteriaceae bacterium]|nr:hypothetical protein [Flavobacteriaceae bacterium]